MDKLIRRLETATEGSRELDTLICAKITNPPIMVDGGGYRGERPVKYLPLSEVITDGWKDWDGIAMVANAFHWTTSIDAALSLVQDGYVRLERYSDGWYATVKKRSKDDAEFVGLQKPAALALCIAALKARQENG